MILVLMMTQTTSQRAAKQARAIKRIRESFPAYFRAFPPSQNYVYGRHTNVMIQEVQKAVEAVDRGECYYVIINVPPRHGKSDVFSRKAPGWILGTRPDKEIIMTSYSGQFIQELSLDAQASFRETAQYFQKRLGRQRADFWTVEGQDGTRYKGKVNAVGLGGSITGRGADFCLIDDYIKNRQEAESEIMRDHLWQSFISDLWTRRAPVHAFLVVATRWHEDDLAGRIIEEHKRNPDFPEFKVVRFPAKSPEGSYLFPERFRPEYYEAQKALGSYAWQALYQNDPVPRTGNMLRADRVNYIDESELPSGLEWRRGWDLASTAKERVKDDPDYTVGTLAAYDRTSKKLYVRDVTRGQWSTLERDKRMVATARRDRDCGCIRVNIEAVAGYVDTYNRIQNELRGDAVVRKTNPDTDKVARASLLEPIFEEGNVFAVKGVWNAEWEKELKAFPGGKHDDQVDSLTVAVHDQLVANRGVKMGRL